MTVDSATLTSDRCGSVFTTDLVLVSGLLSAILNSKHLHARALHSQNSIPVANLYIDDMHRISERSELMLCAQSRKTGIILRVTKLTEKSSSFLKRFLQMVQVLSWCTVDNKLAIGNNDCRQW